MRLHINRSISVWIIRGDLMHIAYNLLKILIVINFILVPFEMTITVLPFIYLLIGLLFVIAFVQFDGVKQVKAVLIIYACSIPIEMFISYERYQSIFLSTFGVFLVMSLVIYFLFKYKEHIAWLENKKTAPVSIGAVIYARLTKHNLFNHFGFFMIQ